MITTLFLLQAAVPPDAPTAPVMPRCSTTAVDEIVVCGSRDNRRYRLDRLPGPAPGLGLAETTIAGANVGIVAEQGAVGGIPTNRAMIRLKIKF